MSRYIDADALADKAKQYSLGYYEEDEWAVPFNEIYDVPSIDIVRCKECKWLRHRETEDFDIYLDCDKPDGGGIPRNEEWFCADGESEGE